MNFFEATLLLWLPLIIIGFGLFDIILIPLTGNHTTARKVSVGSFIIFTTLLISFTYSSVINEPIIYAFENIFGLGIYFKIDLLSYIMMIFAGVMFIVVGLFSFNEIKPHEHKRTFYFFYLLTYVATIGTLMAGDMLSFFLFFEIMTFSTYGLIVHYRKESSYEAANEYVYLGVLGGLSILSGIILLAAYAGTLEWVNLGERFYVMGNVKYVIAALFVLGFGIKAGMVPVHFWIPKVYKEAPFSVNALSSGILTKVGAYGILRVASVLLFGDLSIRAFDDVWRWATSLQIGAVLIWLGIITMITGVMLALMEENIKKMLGYHSVSQMGYIIMGIGVAAYLGLDGAMGYAGAVYHMINHGLFKALLFMVAAVVYFHTKETNMYRLGGLAKKMPLLAFVALIAVLGITGMPFFNGFASKSLLHHAIVEAYEYGHASFIYAEYLFMIVSAGTVASFVKLFSFVFLGKATRSYDMIKVDYQKTMIPMGILAVLITLIGFFPGVLLNSFLIPSVTAIGYAPEFIEKYLLGINFFNFTDLTTMIYIYIGGFVIYFVGVKYHLFHHYLPSWLNIEKILYKPVNYFCEQFPSLCVIRYEKPMVLGDVFIYVVLLTVLLLVLVIRGFG